MEEPELAASDGGGTNVEYGYIGGLAGPNIDYMLTVFY